MDNSIEKSGKNNVMDTLIAIRAGLSYISDVKDKIVMKNIEKKEHEKTQRDIEERIRKNEKEVAETKSLPGRLAQGLIESKKARIKLTARLQEEENSKPAYKKKPTVLLFFAVIGIVGILALDITIFVTDFFGLIVVDSRNISFVAFLGLALVAAGIGMIAGIVFLFRRFTSNVNDNSAAHKNAIFDHNETIRVIRTEILKIDKEIRDLEKKIPDINTTTPETLKELGEERLNLGEDLVNTKEEINNAADELQDLFNEAKQVYMSLKNTYGGIFHPDNWKHLDRVIYYITTGRADTLKDALSILDQRLNAELIASEIKASSNMLAEEINQSKQQITATLMRCADELSSSIYFVGGTVVQSNSIITNRISDSIAAQVQGISASEKLISAQELNNSLQRKISKTSEALLNDYRYVNDLSNYR